MSYSTNNTMTPLVLFCQAMPRGGMPSYGSRAVKRVIAIPTLVPDAPAPAKAAECQWSRGVPWTLWSSSAHAFSARIPLLGWSINPSVYPLVFAGLLPDSQPFTLQEAADLLWWSSMTDIVTADGKRLLAVSPRMTHGGRAVERHYGTRAMRDFHYTCLDLCPDPVDGWRDPYHEDAPLPALAE